MRLCENWSEKAAETVKIENEADDEDEEVLKAFVKALVEAAE